MAGMGVGAREATIDELAAQLSTHADVNERFVMKSSAFRGMVNAMRAAKVADSVIERVPAAIGAYLRNPPIATSWMPAIVFQFVFRTVGELEGEGKLKELARDSIMAGPIKYTRPIIEGTLRLFGASPRAFFKRTPQILSAQLKGMTLEYVDYGQGAAGLRLCYDLLQDVSRSAFVYWEGVLGVTFDICRKPILESATVVSKNAPFNAAEVRFRWDE